MTRWIDAPDAPGWWWLRRNGLRDECVEVWILGGGTTRVFLAADELTGDGAAEMRRWHAAQEHRWYDEMACFGMEPEGEVSHER